MDLTMLPMTLSLGRRWGLGKWASKLHLSADLPKKGQRALYSLCFGFFESMIPMLFDWKFRIDFDILFSSFFFFLFLFLYFCLGLQIPKIRPPHPILPFDTGEEIKKKIDLFHPMATALPYTYIPSQKKRERVDKKAKTIVLRSFPS
jgi:hypothetical protein